MDNFQPVSFDLEKIPEPRQFRRGWVFAGKLRRAGGVGLDFFEQCRHPRTG